MPKALTTTILMSGCERRAFLALLFFCLIPPVAGKTLVSCLIGGLCYVLGVALLRFMARKDPMMMSVLGRHTSFKNFYAARAGIGSDEKPMKIFKFKPGKRA